MTETTPKASNAAKTHPLYFMGRKLGTYDSVDIYPETGLKLFKFTPGEGCQLPSGNLFFDIGRGTARVVTKNHLGDPIDILSAISSCPKVSEKEFSEEEAAIDADNDEEEDEDE